MVHSHLSQHGDNLWLLNTEAGGPRRKLWFADLDLALEVQRRYLFGSKPFLVSYSQVSQFMRCRYRWHLSRIERINARKTPIYFSKGRAVHSMLEHVLLDKHTLKTKGVPFDLADSLSAGYNDYITRSVEEAVGDMSEDERAELVLIGEEAMWLVRKFMDELDIDKYETKCIPGTDMPMIEQGFVVSAPLVAHQLIGVIFYPDWVFGPTGEPGSFLADFKVRSSFTPPEDEDINLQAMIYSRALRDFGVNIDGTASIQIRSAPPTQPKMLKNGTMSRAANIRCDWESYKTALVTHGLDPAEYEDEMELKLSGNNWVQDTRAFRGRHELEVAWADFLRASHELDRELVYSPRGEVPTVSTNPPGVYRVLNLMECRGCWARQYCVADLRGDDLEGLLQTNYYREGDEQTAPAGLESVEMTDG